MKPRLSAVMTLDSASNSLSFAMASLMSPDVPSLAAIPQPQEPLKLGILASGSGSNMEAIAAAIMSQELNAQIQVVVYNNPNAKVADRADRFGVPKVLLNHRQFDSRESLDKAIINTMYEYDVDWVIMAGWMRVVTQVLIDAFPRRILNIHPSLLPSFPGAKAIEQAIASKLKITGCTVHYVELEVDSGPIIIQAAVPVLPDDTPETLHQRIQVQEHRIFPRAIALAASRELSKSRIQSSLK